MLGAPFALAPGIDLTAYRIVQEALTNTLRHTAAARAEVTLSYEPGFVSIDVTDPGPRRARRDQEAAGGTAAASGRFRPAGTAWPGSPSGSPPAAVACGSGR